MDLKYSKRIFIYSRYEAEMREKRSKEDELKRRMHKERERQAEALDKERREREIIDREKKRLENLRRIDLEKRNKERNKNSFLKPSDEDDDDGKEKPTLEGVLQSIGFNFEMSEIMQEKAKKERSLTDKLANDIMSSLGAAMKKQKLDISDEHDTPEEKMRRYMNETVSSRKSAEGDVDMRHQREVQYDNRDSRHNDQINISVSKSSDSRHIMNKSAPKRTVLQSLPRSQSPPRKRQHSPSRIELESKRRQEDPASHINRKLRQGRLIKLQNDLDFLRKQKINLLKKQEEKKSLEMNAMMQKNIATQIESLHNENKNVSILES